MAVVAYCNDPMEVLRRLYQAIQEGRVVTWAADSDGDLTHSTAQWKNRAWMRPRAQFDRITFNIVPPREVQITREIYAIYHGRLIEMLFAHFDDLLRSAAATAMPTLEDRVR